MAGKARREGKMETYGTGNVVWGVFGLHNFRTGNIASAKSIVFISHYIPTLS